MAGTLISIIIPVMNEAENIPALVSRLTSVLDAVDARWEIIFVDDGSTDTTLAAVKSVHCQDPRVVAISFSRNFGKEIAIAAGLRYARGDCAIIMDADLQHPPEMVRAFVAHWRAGYQVVYGQRRNREADGPLRRLFARAFYRVFNALARTDIPEGAGDFRLLDRRAIDAMNSLHEVSRFNKGLFSWIGFRSIGVPYTVAERAHGASKWSFGRLIRFAMDGLTSFSTLPLRVWSLIGLSISATAFAYALAFMVRTLVFGAEIPGFPSLIISTMLFAGVQLISLGVLGEYLGRVYEQVKSRPLFIVAEEVGFARRANDSRQRGDDQHSVPVSER